MRRLRQRFAEVCLWVLSIAPVAFLGCGSKPRPILTQPPISNAKFAYVANQGSNSISMFTVSKAGVWVPTNPETILVSTHPEFLIADLQGRFLYVVSEGETSASRLANRFEIDRITGILTESGSVQAEALPVQANADPAGKLADEVEQLGGGAYSVDLARQFAYVVNKDDDSVTSYAIGLDGRLSRKGTFPTGVSPTSIVLVSGTR